MLFWNNDDLSLFDHFKPSGIISEDVPNFLKLFGQDNTADHCSAVAAKSIELAGQFSCDLSKAEKAGYLHDISAVIPNEKRIDFARRHSIEILPEEAQVPMVIHQKLSVVLANRVFGVTDFEILDAIGCHTTLKARPTELDKIVFLADKIAWDQDGSPPYLAIIIGALEESLDKAVFAYLNYLWQRKDKLKMVHPWLMESYEYFLTRN